MTPPINLPAILSEMNALDEKRTQGEWLVCAEHGANVYTAIELSHIADCEKDMEHITCWNNSRFIAAAPTAVSALRASIELNVKLVEALKLIASCQGIDDLNMLKVINASGVRDVAGKSISLAASFGIAAMGETK